MKQLSCEAVHPVKQKERRIVTWTPQEDDILREQISIHGTDNWTIIASNFKDKTTRQCRRRWYTYLNTDFKKGGWSPEEDLLLCEAQKIYGNRWTEIAKVVSGRTDNAVKNRFTTLCKKRARIQSVPKENNTSTYINANNKRVFSNNNAFQFEHSPTVASSTKKLRSDHIPNLPASCNDGDVWDKGCVTEKHQRPPFAVLAQSIHKIDSATLVDGNIKIEGTFLKKDDPKILALMQQAELLSSLAMKVNTENTEQSLENASVLENFLTKRKDNVVLDYSLSESDSRFEHLHDLLEELRRSNTDMESSQRQSDMYDSPSGSEYSNGSSIMSTNTSEQMEQTQSEMYRLEDDDDEFIMLQATETTSQEEILVPCAEDNVENISALSKADFCSPIQITPLFRSFAATVPSPQFSESERHFLMKTLGIESPPAQNKSTNPSLPPPCRRALVHSL
ncbi:hypothetical protein V2J09_015383 [Rumex salicifolius]